MELFIVFLAGIAVSFVSSFGSGILGITSLTALLALGLSPLTALGTFRVGALGFSLGGLYQYFKAGKIVWNLVVPITCAGILGVVIGVNLIVSVDEAVVGRLLGVVMLLFIPFAIWKPDLGLVRTAVSRRQRLFGHISAFLTTIWGSSMTIGTGFLVTYAQMYFYGLTLLEVRGTNRIPNIIKTVLALVIFSTYSLVNWEVGIIFAAGMLLGSTIGTKYALKIGDVWLKHILLITLGLFALKLILGF